LRVEDETGGTRCISTYNYGDVCTEDGEYTSESGEGGSGELHIWNNWDEKRAKRANEGFEVETV